MLSSRGGSRRERQRTKRRGVLGSDRPTKENQLHPVDENQTINEGEMRAVSGKRKGRTPASTTDEEMIAREETATESGDLFSAADEEDGATGDGGTFEVDAFTQTKTQMEEELQRSMAAGTSRFNPHPDQAEVKEMRKGYARLMTAVKTKKGDLIRPDDTQLNVLLQDANVLLGHVHTTADATLDSRFMVLSAEVGTEKAGKLAAGSMDFTVGDFCALLKEALRRESSPLDGDGEPVADGTGNFSHNWEAIGQMAMQHWRGVAGPDFMLGPISVPAQPRPLRTRTAPLGRERQNAVPIVQPSIINNDEQAISVVGTGVEATTNVIKVYQCLQRVAPVPFYKFITDPTSYARTVENLFYISFLVHDNRVRLWVSEGHGDRQLMLGLANDNDNGGDGGNHDRDDGDSSSDSEGGQSSDTANRGGVKPKHQAIFSMTMRMWREQREKYRLVQPIINLDRSVS